MPGFDTSVPAQDAKVVACVGVLPNRFEALASRLNHLDSIDMLGAMSMGQTNSLHIYFSNMP